MNISFLLAQRASLQKQARLSNLAYAHEQLSVFTERIKRAHLRGQVHLIQAEPLEDRFVSSLTALEGNQSVVDEHFTDHDIQDFVDAVGYATGEPLIDQVFDLREVEARFLTPLRNRLEKLGVVIDRSPAQASRNQAFEFHELPDEDQD